MTKGAKEKYPSVIYLDESSKEDSIYFELSTIDNLNDYMDSLGENGQTEVEVAEYKLVAVKTASRTVTDEIK